MWGACPLLGTLKTNHVLFSDDEIISNANAHRRSIKVHGNSSSGQQNSKVTGKTFLSAASKP